VSNAGTYAVVVRNLATAVTSSFAVVKSASLQESLSSKPTTIESTNHNNSDQQRDWDWPLPSGWAVSSIGVITNQRAEYFTNASRFDLHATSSDISLRITNFFFVFTNNDTHEFRTLLTNWSASGATGILVRQSTSNDAPYVFLGVSNNQVLCWTYIGGKPTRYQMNKPLPSNAKSVELRFDFPANGGVAASWIAPRGSTPILTTKSIDFPLSAGKPSAGYAVFPASTNQTRAQFYPAE
jgi:hypothetical protein